MEKRIHRKIWAAAIVASALAPTVALAEEERSGIALLVPALAELIPACVAFLVVFVVLSKLVWPSVVKSMDAREEAIGGKIKATEEAQAKLAETEHECERTLEEARRTADDIVAKAKQEAEQERARIVFEAHTQANDIIEKGHKAVETERARAMEDLSRSVADLSVEIAGKIIAHDLSDVEHLKLASRYLEEMESEDA